MDDKFKRRESTHPQRSGKLGWKKIALLVIRY